VISVFPHVLVLFNTPGASFSGGSWQESDAGVMAEVEAVAASLNLAGFPNRVRGVASLAEVGNVLEESPEPVVFNLVEQLPGGVFSACAVPGMCRERGKAVTGCGSDCLELCTDKARTKAVLAAKGIVTPRSVVVHDGISPDVQRGLPPGRVIVKPVAADASEGIGPDAVMDSGDASLPDVIRAVCGNCGGPVLVEEFIDGREVNVSLAQMGADVTILPPAEIEFQGFPPGKPRIVDYAAKWRTDSFEYRNTVRRVPAALDVETRERVKAVALAAWDAVGCRGYARVDFRVAGDGAAYVLEVNPDPDISPDAGFAAALKAAGITFGSFVKAMVDNAFGCCLTDGLRKVYGGRE
jgi:D-alanine-D-alanine ligase